MARTHERLTNERPHLKPALRLAQLLLNHCEHTEELCAFVRALLTWVERRGALQDLDLVLVWWRASEGEDALFRLIPNNECELEDAQRIRHTMAALLSTIRGPAHAMM